jgi:hypothetical protein
MRVELSEQGRAYLALSQYAAGLTADDFQPVDWPHEDGTSRQVHAHLAKTFVRKLGPCQVLVVRERLDQPLKEVRYWATSERQANLATVAGWVAQRWTIDEMSQTQCTHETRWSCPLAPWGLHHPPQCSLDPRRRLQIRPRRCIRIPNPEPPSIVASWPLAALAKSLKLGSIGPEHPAPTLWLLPPGLGPTTLNPVVQRHLGHRKLSSQLRQSPLVLTKPLSCLQVGALPAHPQPLQKPLDSMLPEALPAFRRKVPFLIQTPGDLLRRQSLTAKVLTRSHSS